MDECRTSVASESSSYQIWKANLHLRWQDDCRCRWPSGCTRQGGTRSQGLKKKKKMGVRFFLTLTCSNDILRLGFRGIQACGRRLTIPGPVASCPLVRDNWRGWLTVMRTRTGCSFTTDLPSVEAREREEFINILFIWDNGKPHWTD